MTDLLTMAIHICIKTRRNFCRCYAIQRTCDKSVDMKLSIGSESASIVLRMRMYRASGPAQEAGWLGRGDLTADPEPEVG